MCRHTLKILRHFLPSSFKTFHTEDMMTGYLHAGVSAVSGSKQQLQTVQLLAEAYSV